MTSLRPYQSTFVANIRQSLAKHKRIIACLATGGGKTKCFISISHQAISVNRSVIIISESTKIYKQIKSEVSNCTHIAEGVKEFILSPQPTVYVAMAQTLANRPFILSQLHAMGSGLLIIVDEAHISTPTRILKQLPDAYLIGFTATPVAKFAKHLLELYNDCVVGPQPQELIELGHLEPYKHYSREIVDLSNLKKSSTGDYTEQSQENAFEKREVFEGLYNDLLLFNGFRACMVYTASIKHCSSVARQLRNMGYNVSECHSKNPNSDFELFEFTSGKNNICVSVASLTKGFDYPAIDLVVLQRATLSLPLLLQMIGRGGRTAPNKQGFICLDYGQNGKRLGLWNMDRDYAKLWKETKADKALQPPPMKDCPKCGYMMLASKMKCDNCGHIFVKTASEIKRETQLIELTEGFNKLKGKRVGELSPIELAEYVKFTNRKAFGKRIARARGSKFLEEYAKAIGWNYGWWNYIQPEPELDFANIVVR